MHRTNVYLTEVQERALDARAKAARTTRSAVLRDIVDEALRTSPMQADESLDAAFDELSAVYADVTRGLFDDDDDVRID